VNFRYAQAHQLGTELIKSTSIVRAQSTPLLKAAIAASAVE
jgi:hypothetical protein